VEQREEAPGQHPQDEPQPRVAGADGGGEGDDRAHEHHPLDAEVEDAGPLGEDLAERGEEQDGPRGDARVEDDRGVHQAARRSIRKR